MITTFKLEHCIAADGKKQYRFSDRPDDVSPTPEELYEKRGLPSTTGTFFYDHGGGLHTLVNDEPVRI